MYTTDPYPAAPLRTAPAESCSQRRRTIERTRALRRVVALAPVAALLASCGGGAEPSAASSAAANAGPRTAPRAAATCPQSAAANAGPQDEVLYWNQVYDHALSNAAPPIPGPLQARTAAIVHVAMFEALNGIERRFTPIAPSHVIEAQAPSGASAPQARRAAVVQAAFTALTALFPGQSFADDRRKSLEAIGVPDDAIDNSASLALGLSWGEQVAKDILRWRAGDIPNPPPQPYLGSNEIGAWRPTPPAFAPGVAPWMATMQPFVIPSPSSFRPAGPQPLTSAKYAADVNEVKIVGEFSSLVRTDDQKASALFWNSTALLFWNGAARTAALQRHMSLSENARLFAVLNAAVADALIAAWDSKYTFSLWRPITAIELADLDGNPDTVSQPGWTPLVTTPAYPEYYSGHHSVSRTSQAILTAHFGDAIPVGGTSAGFTRCFPNFTAAADEAFMARIWAGIHFRFAMHDTQMVAEQIAAYVLSNVALPLDEARRGE
jgi:hypothetical protein